MLDLNHLKDYIDKCLREALERRMNCEHGASDYIYHTGRIDALERLSGYINGIIREQRKAA